MQSLIVGNWNMFKTVREAELFARRLVAELEIIPGREVVIAPAFPALYAVAAVLRGSAIKLAAVCFALEMDGFVFLEDIDRIKLQIQQFTLKKNIG